MKEKFFAGILVTAMLLVSVGALAKTNSDTVPFDGGGYGLMIIGISENGYSAWADSISYSANNEVLSTRINGYGPVPDNGTGSDHAEATGNFNSAESWHSFFGRTGCNMYIYR